MGFRLSSTDGSANGVGHQSAVEDTDDPLVTHAINFAMKKGLSTCPLDVKGLAEALGANVISKYDMPDEIIGRVTVDKKDPKKCDIRLNMNVGTNRLRFTLAHELGHYLKHQHWAHKEITPDDLPSNISFNRSSKIGGDEWEANAFASQLLMPGEEVRKAKGEGLSLQELSKMFDVSKTAMKIRLEELGID